MKAVHSLIHSNQAIYLSCYYEIVRFIRHQGSFKINTPNQEKPPKATPDILNLNAQLLEDVNTKIQTEKESNEENSSYEINSTKSFFVQKTNKIQELKYYIDLLGNVTRYSFAESAPAQVAVQQAINLFHELRSNSLPIAVATLFKFFTALGPIDLRISLSVFVFLNCEY